MKHTVTSLLVATFVLTIFMLLVATMAKNPVLIFPEGAALAFGCWVFREERWLSRPWQIVALPTVSAVLGVGLNHIALGYVLREMIALVVVITLLFVFKSLIGPSISAALLPIVLGIYSWLFVLTVFGVTLLVAIGVWNEGKEIHRENKVIKKEIIYLIIGLVWVGISQFFSPDLLVIPPMMVVLYEALAKEFFDYKLAIRQLGLLFSSSLAGALAVHVFPGLYVVSGAMAIIATVFFMYVFNTRLAPAMAISLLPLLLGNLPIWKFPLYILIDGVIFFLVAGVFHVPLRGGSGSNDGPGSGQAGGPPVMIPRRGRTNDGSAGTGPSGDPRNAISG